MYVLDGNETNRKGTQYYLISGLPNQLLMSWKNVEWEKLGVVVLLHGALQVAALQVKPTTWMLEEEEM